MTAREIADASTAVALEHPGLNASPSSPERNLAPMLFAPGTDDGLVSGPNPRLISDVICGGTGAQGQNGQTTDAVASAWLYVFGQFIDHDLGLEVTPTSAVAINIVVPPGDTVLVPGSIIAMNRAVRGPLTHTIVNSAAGYLDLSQRYGSNPAGASSGSVVWSNWMPIYSR